MNLLNKYSISDTFIILIFRDIMYMIIKVIIIDSFIYNNNNNIYLLY